MKSTLIRRGLGAAAFLIGATPLSAATVGPSVAGALAAHGSVRVVVALKGSSGPADAPAARRALSARTDAVLETLAPGDLTLRQRWAVLPGFVGDVTAEGLAGLARHPEVLAIDADVSGGGNAAVSVPMVGGDQVQAMGYTGAGITVAVLDSGTSASHPDLAGAVVAEECFCARTDGSGCCPDGTTHQSGPGSAADDHGHGTNVCGILASRGVVAAKGVAPGASIVAVKVLDADNVFSGSAQVLSGLDFLLASHPEVKVVNMSLGTSTLFTGTCNTATSYTRLFAAALNALSARGTTTFVSSGNDRSPSQMECPACIDAAIAVGAVWKADVGSQTVLGCTDATTARDKTTCFSNGGSALDLMAPGAPITSSGRGGGRSTFYGTSQASPHAAGGAALLLSKNGSLTSDQIETALKSTGLPVTDQRTGSVVPRIRLVEAIQSVPVAGGNVWVLPSSARIPGQGAFWTTDLTVRNNGTAAVDVALKFLGHEGAGANGPEKGLRIAAGATVTWRDVLSSIFSLDADYGPLLVRSPSAALSVVGQTWTPGEGGGTYGQSVPGMGPLDLIGATARTIPGLRQDTSFRSAIYLANVTETAVEATVTVVSSVGDVLGVRTVLLDPYGFVQMSLDKTFGLDGVVDASALVAVTTPGGSVGAYGSVIDQTTADPRTILAR